MQALAPEATLDTRTGDTPSHRKQKQMRQPPNVLITTPESLGLMLSYATAAAVFRHLSTVIVDEWHELMDSKRGSQLTLCLARLRTLAPGHTRWGLTATVANPEQAMGCLCADTNGVLIQAQLQRPIELECLTPPQLDQLPWAGHYGLSQLRFVAQRLDRKRPALIFTNTRAQAETWFEALRIVRADLEPAMALHHGSLDKDEREQVEQRLKQGELAFVVCTSSLDLGVDFSTIDEVFQIGSIKRIARLIQRAGRAGHRPGASCRVICVPTMPYKC